MKCTEYKINKHMLVRLYRKYLSDSFRKKIYNLFLGQILLFYRRFSFKWKGKFIYLFSPLFPQNEYYDAYRFVGKHGVTTYPFEASLKYKKIPIAVLSDGYLSYVVHNNKKLYFPRQIPKAEIIDLYHSLLIEQDSESAHRYVESYTELKDKVLLDIGAAEGIFALDAIDYVKKIYLFECEDQWIEPLHETFKPWKEKVEIIQKYVGENDSGKYITLDSFMSEREQCGIHLKMDIEGAEQSALRGVKNLLTNGKFISFSICTYHKAHDAKAISSFFETQVEGYRAEFTKGYFVFNESYIRKAIYRGRNY